MSKFAAGVIGGVVCMIWTGGVFILGAVFGVSIIQSSKSSNLKVVK